jgi:ubiquinone/menaquinone biosynthesis C-methylase UbiE
MNEPFIDVTPGEPLKGEIAGIWDEHAGTYDHAGGQIRTPEERNAWRSHIARALPQGKLDVLDVGCGTGEISLLMARMGHNITGIDISEKMMRQAVAKAMNSGLAIDFRSGDAERTGFPDGSFDVVICRFLLWTLPDPQAALHEWYRVLKPGGKVLIIDGKWHDDTFGYKLVKTASNLDIRMMDGKRTEKCYSEELTRSLTNLNGVPPGVARGYLDGAGFRGIVVADLEEVRKIKLLLVPWRYRAGIGRMYYLISGKKTGDAVQEE